MDRTEYEFYLDLRKYGTVPHGGFGIGIERMVTFAAGTKNIRDHSIPTYICTVSNRKNRKTPMWRFSHFLKFLLAAVFSSIIVVWANLTYPLPKSL